jgi:hypothetical protein
MQLTYNASVCDLTHVARSIDESKLLLCALKRRQTELSMVIRSTIGCLLDEDIN